MLTLLVSWKWTRLLCFSHGDILCYQVFRSSACLHMSFYWSFAPERISLYYGSLILCLINPYCNVFRSFVLSSSMSRELVAFISASSLTELSPLLTCTSSSLHKLILFYDLSVVVLKIFCWGWKNEFVSKVPVTYTWRPELGPPEWYQSQEQCECVIWILGRQRRTELTGQPA